MTDQPGQGGRYDLVILGGTAGGLSVAISSKRSGIQDVRVVEPGSTVAFPELVPENQLRGSFVIDGSDTDILVFFTLSPESVPLIQHVSMATLQK